MVVRTVLFTALAAAALLQGYHDWQLRPVHPSDGPIAPADPQQADADGARITTLGRWRLKPRARYDITARILVARTITLICSPILSRRILPWAGDPCRTIASSAPLRSRKGRDFIHGYRSRTCP